MASSGTFSFNPSIGELVLYAYSLIQVRRTAILQEHLVDARMALNLMLVEWSAKGGPNLWTVDLVTQVLTAETSTYSVDAKTVMILDAYISTGSDPTIDRIISPVSRTEYASFPNKTTSGFPTVFWFDRLIAPTITLWQPPDSSQTYTLKYYRCIQIQDANLPSGETLNVQYRFLDSFAWGLAARLAVIYKPEMAQAMDTRAERAWNIAATSDTENVNLNIVPAIGGYYRQ